MSFNNTEITNKINEQLADVDPTKTIKHFRVQTRNWNQHPKAKELLDIMIEKANGSSSDDSSGGIDNKYIINATSHLEVFYIASMFYSIQQFSGGSVYIFADDNIH